MKLFIHIPEHHESPKWERIVAIHLVAKMMIEYQKLYKADSRQFNDEVPGDRLYMLCFVSWCAFYRVEATVIASKMIPAAVTTGLHSYPS